MSGSFSNSVVSSRFGSKASCFTQANHENVSDALPPVGLKSFGGRNRLLVKTNSVDSREGDFDGASLHDDSIDLGGGRFASISSTDRPGVKAGALSAGWSKQSNALCTKQQECSSTVDVSDFALSRLNQMYAYMEQAMSRERARHSSDVHMLMRRIDKDLKDTFRTVRATFISLTQQVQELLREVNSGKKSISSIQAKFDAATASAAIRGQYVEELEAVLDGQVPNISEAMRKLSEDLAAAKMNIERGNKEAAEKENQMTLERAKLRAMIKSLEERLNEREVSGFAGATELPLLPEMAATWTRRQQRPHTTDATCYSDPAADSDGGVAVDVLGSTMAQSDATRAVTRMKCVRPLGKRPSTTPAGAPGRQMPRCVNLTRSQQRLLEAKVAELKQSVQEAELRVARQQKLYLEMAPSLQLLRDIFALLHQNWRLHASYESDNGVFKDIETVREELAQEKKAPELLDRITAHFVEAFPQLGCFSEVLDALCEEASRPAPRLSNVLDGLEDGFVSNDGLSPIADTPTDVGETTTGEGEQGEGDAPGPAGGGAENTAAVAEILPVGRPGGDCKFLPSGFPLDTPFINMR